MLNLFKKGIVETLAMLHTARVKPFENINKWLFLQERIIKNIIYIERNIRKSKEEISALNKYRKTPNNRIDKEESNRIKNTIKYNQYKIDEYKYTIDIYKSIGDGIAFTFLNKHDIKPQNFKESPGFISEKHGIKKEKQYMRYAFKKGLITIFNDITSTLKYADLIIITPNGPVAIEAKSSSNDNPRLQRQENKANKIFNYLANDTTEDLYDIPGTVRRVSNTTPEKNHTKKLNALIFKAEEQGYAYKKVEKGVLYFVATQEPEQDELGRILKISKLKDPYAFFFKCQ